MYGSIVFYKKVQLMRTKFHLRTPKLRITEKHGSCLLNLWSEDWWGDGDETCLDTIVIVYKLIEKLRVK